MARMNWEKIATTENVIECVGWTGAFGHIECEVPPMKREKGTMFDNQCLDCDWQEKLAWEPVGE